MRIVPILLMILIFGGPAQSLEPRWCVHKSEKNQLHSLGYSFGVEDDGITCMDFVKPFFQVWQKQQNTCLFWWWLNIPSQAVPNVEFVENYMVKGVVDLRERRDWRQSFCYRGMNNDYHMFRSCDRPDYHVWSNWEILEQDLLDLDRITFTDNADGTKFTEIVVDRVNLGEAFERYQQLTGCPALF